jgi:hypothetical protein
MTNHDTKQPKFGVVQVEVETGVILTVDGQWRLSGAIPVIPADTIEEARRVAENIVATSHHIECSIRDDKGRHIEFVRNR